MKKELFYFLTFAIVFALSSCSSDEDDSSSSNYRLKSCASHFEKIVEKVSNTDDTSKFYYSNDLITKIINKNAKYSDSTTYKYAKNNTEISEYRGLNLRKIYNYSGASLDKIDYYSNSTIYATKSYKYSGGLLNMIVYKEDEHSDTMSFNYKNSVLESYRFEQTKNVVFRKGALIDSVKVYSYNSETNVYEFVASSSLSYTNGKLTSSTSINDGVVISKFNIEYNSNGLVSKFEQTIYNDGKAYAKYTYTYIYEAGKGNLDQLNSDLIQTKILGFNIPFMSMGKNG